MIHPVILFAPFYNQRSLKNQKLIETKNFDAALDLNLLQKLTRLTFTFFKMLLLSKFL